MQHRFIRGHLVWDKMDKWGYMYRQASSRAVKPCLAGRKLHLAAAAWALATVPNATGRGQPLSGLTIKQ